MFTGRQQIMQDQAEKLRSAVKLQSEQSGSTARVITVVGGKCGVGKSTVAQNLAVWLSKANKRVIIFDTDMGVSNIELMTGKVPKYSLTDVIYRGRSMKDIVTEGPSGVGFIAAGMCITALNSLDYVQMHYLVQSLGELDKLADYIIIDIGAGTQEQVIPFVINSPEVLLVATPDPSVLTNTYSLLKTLYKKPDFTSAGTSFHVVANQVNSQKEGIAVYDRLRYVVTEFLRGEMDFYGLVPTDPMIEQAERYNKVISVVDQKARSARAFAKIAENLSRDTKENVPEKWGISQMFSSIFTRR
jgi:flagellar biosynthesis protein FlhG